MTVLRKVVADTIRLALAGLAIGLGMMVAHEPGSNEFLLRWDATKFVFPLVGATSAAAIVALIRWHMWRRSHPQALD